MACKLETLPIELFHSMTASSFSARFRSLHLSTLLCLSLALPVAAVTPTRFDAVARQAEAARSANQVPDAIRLYREATRLNPAWSDGWWYLGSLYYDQDRFSEAALAFQHIQDNSKYHGTAHAFLGLCEYETGQYDDALEQFLAWARAGSAGTRELRNAGFYHFALLLARDGRFAGRDNLAGAAPGRQCRAHRGHGACFAAHAVFARKLPARIARAHLAGRQGRIICPDASAPI